MKTLDQRSARNLVGVDLDLVAIVIEAMRRSPVEFFVNEGVRQQSRQKMLFSTGASQTLNSRHLTGHAVDVVAVIDDEVRWVFPLYERIAEVMKAVAAERGVKITWGGDWESLRDGPHFELTRVGEEQPVSGVKKNDEQASSDCAAITLQINAPSTRDRCVEALQRALNLWAKNRSRAEGAKNRLIIDGLFGQQTQRMVMDFQRARGISADGIVGEQTWQAIKPWHPQHTSDGSQQ